CQPAQPRSPDRRPERSSRATSHDAGRCRAAWPGHGALPWSLYGTEGHVMSSVDYNIRLPAHADDAPVEASARQDDLASLRPLPRISIHAFCESEAMQRTMERMSHDRRMAKVNMRITNGSTDAAANMFTFSPTPNLIILETDAQPRHLLQELAPLAEVCDPSTRVIVVGRYNDIPLYRDLIRNGISEYLVGPVQTSDMLSSIAAIFIDPEAEPLGKSVAFIGAKGG